MTTQIQTKKEIIEALANQGVTGPAAQLAAKQGAAARHAGRVDKAYEELRDDTPVQAMFHALLDEIGIGGVDGLEGAASDRYPYLSDLPGKQAGSGGAWTAAIREAAARFADDAGLTTDASLFVRPGKCVSKGPALSAVDLEVGTYCPGDGKVYMAESMPFYPGLDEDGAENDDDRMWLRSMAGLAVRALLGMPVRRTTTPFVACGPTTGFFVHRDDLVRWATVFNAACNQPPSDEDAFRYAYPDAPRGDGWVYVEVA